MSEWSVRTIQIDKIEKHPNADALSITQVDGYPLIFRTVDFNLGDKSVYIAGDSLVPKELAPFLWKEGDTKTHKRIKAIKLRGIFSMGLLIKCDQALETGLDMSEKLGVTKYEPPLQLQGKAGGENEPDQSGMPFYTEIESHRKYPDLLQEGEQVVITEKLHGANSRFRHDGTRLWVGSHKAIKKECAENIWWKAAALYNLAEKLAKHPTFVFFGELLGVQDLAYGFKTPERPLGLAFFDIFDLGAGRYLEYAQMAATLAELELPPVPILYSGPWSKDYISMAEGQSILAKHIREGIVIKPACSRWDPTVGRVILKRIGEGYQLR